MKVETRLLSKGEKDGKEIEKKLATGIERWTHREITGSEEQNLFGRI